MKFEELKKTLKEKLSLQKNELKKSDEEMEIEAASWWNRFFEVKDRFAKSNSYKGDFAKLGELLKEINLSYAEFDVAEMEGLVHFIYAPTNECLGSRYAMYFDDSMIERDYDAVGRKVRLNLNKLFKSAVYKEGVGILILDMDEAEDVWEKMEIARKNLDASIPMMSND